MANVKIGGVDYHVPELNFIALERAWPYIEEAMTTGDPIKGPSAGIRIIAAGLTEAEGFDKSKFDVPEDVTDPEKVFDAVTFFLKKKLKASEITDVRECVLKITEEAGLKGEEGETQGDDSPQTQSPSTEIAASSSQSSLPQELKEEAGTQ